MISLNKRTDKAWSALREERDRLLRITDAYLLPDRGTERERTEIAEYRAQLRKLPTSAASPALITFPTPPAFIKELKQ